MTDNKSGEILIIEDDKDINDLLATALSKAGYRTRQAWSGTEGELLLKLEREAYALVLLDLMLPGLSGEELLARIRQMDASLPVIILTAKDELDEKINLLVAGADDYIVLRACAEIPFCAHFTAPPFYLLLFRRCAVFFRSGAKCRVFF